MVRSQGTGPRPDRLPVFAERRRGQPYGDFNLFREHGFANPIAIPLITLGGHAGTAFAENPIVSHIAMTSGAIVDTGDSIFAHGVRCAGARITLRGYLVDAPTP